MMRSVSDVLNTYITPLAGPVKAYGVGFAAAGIIMAVASRKMWRDNTYLKQKGFGLELSLLDMMGTASLMIVAKRVQLLKEVSIVAVPMVLLNGVAFLNLTLKYDVPNVLAQLAETSWKYSSFARQIFFSGLMMYELRNRSDLVPFYITGMISFYLGNKYSKTTKITKSLEYISYLSSAVLLHTEDNYTKTFIAANNAFIYLRRSYPNIFIIKS